jgi:hypothetical protein
MPMARINNSRVVEVGLPESLRGTSNDRLHKLGWRLIVGTPRPSPKHEYGAPWTYNEDEDVIYGTWTEVDRSEEIAKAQLKQIRKDRANAYTDEADPLFFKYQRVEGSKQDWLDKIEEIRERFPYPTED